MTSVPPDKHSRAPLERMLKIHGRLHDGAYPNCSTLAQALATSVKTVQRDVEFMRDRMGLPIDYDPARKGYYYTEEVTSFPTVTVTEGELVALLIAQKAVEQYRGTPLEKTLSAAFAKITSQLRDEITFDASDISTGVSFRSVGTAVTEITTFEQLAGAVRARRETVLQYRKLEAAKAETRRVHPYHLACIQNCWYLLAHDMLRAGIRKFALPRIKSLQVGKTRFVRPQDFSAEKYFGESFGVFTGDQQITVQILFDRFAAALISERIWHKTQKFKRRPGGALLLTMQVPRLEEVQTWVLGWGSHAKVIAPRSLAVEVRRTAAEIVARYPSRRARR